MTELTEKVKKDALKSGFPSELVSESIFRKRNWSFSGNTYFIDQDENKGREIDASVYKMIGGSQTKPEIFCWTMLSVEIKKSEKPWVIFTSERARFFEKGFTCILSHTNKAPPKFSEDIIDKYHPCYQLPRLGRTSQVAFSHDTATMFGSFISSAKATLESFRQAEKHKEIYSDTSTDIVMYEPLVVVDGPLFECYLNENQELMTEQVNLLQYALHYASPNYKANTYMVNVVTLKYLDMYLAQNEQMLQQMHSKIASMRGA
ncbi:MAG: hypothetical protein AB1780_02675 [Pseudomonadota bacterium]